MIGRLCKDIPLYVALSMHPHKHEGDAAFSQYHWSIIAGPSFETPLSKGTRYHLIYTKEGDEYVPRVEKDRIPLGIGSGLVVRAKIGMLTKMQDLERIVTGLPVVNLVEPTCEMWVAQIVSTLNKRANILRKWCLEWYMVRAWVLAMAEDSGRGYKTDMSYNRVVDLAKRMRSLPDQRYFSMRPVLVQANNFADDMSSALSLTSTESLAEKVCQ
ncbi:hypothetical protein Cpir12675_001793 [Ceratocystis pirilliformis]|uniref:Uncharacterized protein n=1 Tax=Ceratocystis pirilliformis TaxID=259994 RepID=A0ABR3ZDC9_9PEZI